MLKYIKNPPKKLYAIGNIKLLKENSIAIIGSRYCTNYGEKVTEKITKELAMRDICIVSGMAKGIDGIAHRSTINVGGKTIAVLGSGFNHIYPKENTEIFTRIINNNGLVITEYEPEVEAKSKNFPERNRIVSGLSLGVLVVEAGYRSGTSITANLAMKQRKKVMCIPSDIYSNKGIGTNELIKKGAILVSNVDEILKQFNEFKNNKIKKIERKCFNVNNKYKAMYNLIGNDFISTNEIARILKKPIYEIESAITMLEVEEVIEVIPGKGIRRKDVL